MKSSTVEWLLKQFKKYDYSNTIRQSPEYFEIVIPAWVFKELEEQAIEMEKTALIEAHKSGIESGIVLSPATTRSSEEYFRKEKTN